MGSCLSCSEAEAPKDEVEEEEVKEVLSETPNARPSIAAVKEEEEQDNKKPVAAETRVASRCDERPAAPEIQSESFSALTQPELREVREDERPEAARQLTRSTCARDDAVGASLVSGELTRKRPVSGELAPCRPERAGGITRSSPSPARRRDGGVGRTLSARGAAPAAKQAQWAKASGARRAPAEGATARGGGEDGEEYIMAGEESLENPLVSLECFIFL